MVKKVIVIFFIGLLFTSCENEINPSERATIATTEANDLGFSEATLNGSIQIGSAKIEDCGFLWDDEPALALDNDTEVRLGSKKSDQSLSFRLQGLEPSSTYYFRTYVILESGTVNYGEELSFTTLQHSEFTTLPAEGISFTEVSLAGVLSIHDDEIFDCGFVWSTNPQPTTATADKKYFGPQNSSRSFSFHISGLDLNTTYYYRPFIITSSGILYGEELSFTTLSEIEWQVPGGFPGEARMSAISFVIGSKAYLGLGHGFDQNSNIKYFSDFWEFNMITNEWTQKGDYPGGPRSGASAFVIGNNGYVGIGAGRNDGEPDGARKDFWEYNPTNDSWTRKADYLGGRMSHAAAFALNNRGYFGTGVENGNGSFVKTFYEYNPETNEWTRKADFPGLAVDQAIGFSIGEYGYIGMGLRMESWLGNTKQLWAYLPASNTWVQKSDCPSTLPLYGSIAFVINNLAYVGLGWGAGGTIWVYNPDTNGWAADGETTSRISAVTIVVGETALIGTGATGGSFYKDFEVYDPK